MKKIIFFSAVIAVIFTGCVNNTNELKKEVTLKVEKKLTIKELRINKLKEIQNHLNSLLSENISDKDKLLLELEYAHKLRNLTSSYLGKLQEHKAELIFQELKHIQFKKISIRSNVNNDKVFVDGKYIGKTPATIKLFKDKKHIVQVKKLGYETAQRVMNYFNIINGDEIKFKLKKENYRNQVKRRFKARKNILQPNLPERVAY